MPRIATAKSSGDAVQEVLNRFYDPGCPGKTPPRKNLRSLRGADDFPWMPFTLDDRQGEKSSALPTRRRRWLRRYPCGASGVLMFNFDKALATKIAEDPEI